MVEEGLDIVDEADDGSVQAARLKAEQRRWMAERDAALLKAGLTRADLAEHVAAGSGISAEEERALRAQVLTRLLVIVHTHTLSRTPGLSLTIAH